MSDYHEIPTANGSDHHEIHTAIGSGPTIRYTQPMGVITMKYTQPMGIDFHVGDCLAIFAVVSCRMNYYKE